MADVGGIVATHHAKRLECAVCGVHCEPEIIERRTVGTDQFERLRCASDATTFRRIWIGGYR